MHPRAAAAVFAACCLGAGTPAADGLHVHAGGAGPGEPAALNASAGKEARGVPGNASAGKAHGELLVSARVAEDARGQGGAAVSSTARVFSLQNSDQYFEEAYRQLRNSTRHRNRWDCSGIRLMVIVFGLMRTYEQTWPILRQQVDLDGFRQCGADIHLIVSTSLKVRCSKKDLAMGGQRCPDEWRRPSNEQYLQRIKEVYHPYLRAVFESETYSSMRVPETLRTANEMDDQMQSLTAVMHRSHAAESYMREFTHVLAVRTDGVFTPNQLYFNVLGYCNELPGFNVIHGDYEAPCFIHNRDSDKAFLACDPMSIFDFFQPAASCSGMTTLPPIPPDFGGAWNESCAGWYPNGSPLETHECKQIVQFQTAGKRLGTLDEKTYVRIVRMEGALDDLPPPSDAPPDGGAPLDR